MVARLPPLVAGSNADLLPALLPALIVFERLCDAS